MFTRKVVFYCSSMAGRGRPLLLQGRWTLILRDGLLSGEAIRFCFLTQSHLKLYRRPVPSCDTPEPPFISGKKEGGTDYCVNILEMNLLKVMNKLEKSTATV